MRNEITGSQGADRQAAPTSPVNGSSDVELLEQISVADIAAVYSHDFNIDVAKEFHGVDTIGLYRCKESGLRFFHPAVTGSESFYESLQRQPWYYLKDKPEYDVARKLISKSDDVLEVGCGSGEFAKALNAKNYLGLEFSQKAQEMAAADGIRVLKESVENHCTRHTAQYDVVCAFQVLEHVADVSAFIGACVSCLRPGGLLIYSVPNNNSFLAYSQNGVLNLPPHHMSWWTDAVFRNVAPRFGLEIHQIDCERLSDLHVAGYATAVVREALLRVFSKTTGRNRLVDLSLRTKIISRLAGRLSKPLAMVLADANLRPVGHSITVALRKSMATMEGEETRSYSRLAEVNC